MRWPKNYRSHRSWNMSRITSRDTEPERAVAKTLKALRFRLTLNDQRLPGTPDIVLPRHSVAILVHGCYWHRHKGCMNCTTPGSNKAFWLRKFEANVRRDLIVRRRLRTAGYRVITIWECQTEDPQALRKLVLRSLRRVKATMRK